MLFRQKENELNETLTSTDLDLQWIPEKQEDATLSSGHNLTLPRVWATARTCG